VTISNISGGSCESHGADRANRLEQFVQRLQGDDSTEAKGVKDSFQKLVDDQKSGTADASTLQADRKALHDAMHAYREAKGPSDGAERPHHKHHGAEGAAPDNNQPAWYGQNGASQNTTIVQVGISVNIQA
jgi:hypothetical protein